MTPYQHQWKCTTSDVSSQNITKTNNFSTHRYENTITYIPTGYKLKQGDSSENLPHESQYS